MRGFVETPERLVDHMVAKLFRGKPPQADSTVLDPGCGTGAFIWGVVRWCKAHRESVPRVFGVEQDPTRASEAMQSLGHLADVVMILNEDFLVDRSARFDYIIGNPPYVGIERLSKAERETYRRRYSTAVGRFDLYLLFFEEALKELNEDGRLVFVTPEKFLYVRTALPLRRKLAALTVEEIELMDEATFGRLTTYPTVTSVLKSPGDGATDVRLRDGQVRRIQLPADGNSWLPALNGMHGPRRASRTLADLCVRVSCGVATGADSEFVVRDSDVGVKLKRYAHPTIAGREIKIGMRLVTTHSMLVPYDRQGALLRKDELGDLGDYLRQPDRRRRLLARTCASRKPWYAFHETPPLNHMLRPKILCKDIVSRPFFVIDAAGEIVPRHSVYYIVPRQGADLQQLCDYLNSEAVHSWLIGHCQRAANGFLRLQSHVLKQVPIPGHLLPALQLDWEDAAVANA